MTNEEKILEMLGAMQNQMGTMQGEIENIRADLTGVKSDVQGLKSDMQGLKSDMQGVKLEITKLHGKIDTLTTAHEETRDAVNAIVDWTDRVSEVYELPLPKL